MPESNKDPSAAATSRPLAGFVPIDFWASMNFRREPSIQPFVEDKEMQKIEQLFKAFCIDLRSSADYANPPAASPIPPTIHFIWLGSAPSEATLELIATWKYHHPGWEIILWDDEKAQKLSWSDGHSHSAFNDAKSFAEKADILRYNILYQFGGIYSDVDFLCLKSFNDLIAQGLTLFAGQETNKVCSSDGKTLCLCNGLIGAAKGSSIIKKCIDNIITQEEAPTKDLRARTGPLLFTQACREGLQEAKEKVLILPCSYFYPLPYIYRRIPPKEILLHFVAAESLALHLWNESWNVCK